MFKTFLRLVAFVVLAAICVLALFRLAALIRETSQVPPPDVGSFVQTPSGAIFVQSAGPDSGTPILLAHGTAAWSGFWANEVAMLAAAGFQAHAFDMPPFGFSDRATDGDYSRTAQAQRILDLAAAMNIKPILVAHSFGGAAATEAALMQPDAFAGLILVDAALGMTSNPTPGTMPLPLRPKVLRQAAVSASVTNPLLTGVLLRGLLYNKDAATKSELDVLRLPLGRPGSTAAYSDWLPSLLAPRADTLSRNPDNYADLALRVELIWGEQDTVTPPDQAEALARALGQSPVIYLKETGHIPHIESPEAFADALRAALARIME